VVLAIVINTCLYSPRRQYNTIQYKTYNAPYVTKMLFVGAMSAKN